MTEDNATVLVVEDEPPLVEIYARWLETEFDVRTAGSGQEALDELDQSVNVVLLDRLMPGMSGDEVLPEITERAPDAKVAMVTAVTPDFDVLGMGFDDYVTKPVDRGELLDTVYRLLERDEYDELEQELYALVSKCSALRAARTEAELEHSEEYSQLIADIEALREDLDTTLADLEDTEFVSMVREISKGDAAGGGGGGDPGGASGGGNA